MGNSGLLSLFYVMVLNYMSYRKYSPDSELIKCRLDAKYPICNMFKLFICAVCQVEIQPREGVSIYAGSSNRGKLRAWDGPFLCLSCQEKKEAMEGKRPSGGL